MSLSTFRLWRSFLVGLLCFGAALSANAGVIPIDFNDFFADPVDQVNIIDASNATLSEGDFNALLSNVPGLGDPEVIKASPGAKLLFDYVFSMPDGNADEFSAAVLDGNSGDPIAGLEFIRQTGDQGTVEFDLSALVGTVLGLQFELVPLSAEDLLTSSVALSNLRLVTPEPPTSVPTPSTLLLLCSGLAMIMLVRRRV